MNYSARVFAKRLLSNFHKHLVEQYYLKKMYKSRQTELHIYYIYIQLRRLGSYTFVSRFQYLKLFPDITTVDIIIRCT